MPTIIAFASWKGGTGKTLLALNTALQAQQAGFDVRLYDFDPQGVALRYLQQRDLYSNDLPALDAARATVGAEAARILKQKAANNECDLIVCDMPGADDYALDQVIAEVDSVLIPISPAPVEIMVTAQLIHHGVAAGWNMTLIPNNLPSTKYRRQYLLNTMNGMGTQIAPVALARRVTYWDATNLGQSVCEYAPKSAAAEEIRSLWSWIADRIIGVSQQGEAPSVAA